MSMLSEAFYNSGYTVTSVCLARDVPERSCCQTCTLWCLPGARVRGTPHSRPPRPCRSHRPGSTSSYTPQWSPAGPEAEEIKMMPTRTQRPPWPSANNPQITASKYSLKIPNFNLLQSTFHPLQTIACWLNIWTMQSVTYTPYLPRVYNLMLKGLKVLLQPLCGRKDPFTMGQPIPVLFHFPSLTVPSGTPALALCHLLRVQHKGRVSLTKEQNSQFMFHLKMKSISVFCVQTGMEGAIPKLDLGSRALPSTVWPSRGHLSSKGDKLIPVTLRCEA